MNILKHGILCCSLLAAIGCGKSTSQLAEQMKSPDSVTRLHAVHGLKDRVKEPAVAVPALMGALKDEDTFIRRDAAKALGRFGPDASPAVPSLNNLLRDKEPSVRKAAAQSLKQINANS